MNRWGGPTRVFRCERGKGRVPWKTVAARRGAAGTAVSSSDEIPMIQATRREFLQDVGRGMLVASVGAAVAADLGLAPSEAAEAPQRLSFGAREPLVRLMQETSADRLLPILVEKLRTGTSLRDLVAAAALANARAFGGEDYVGFHTLMALTPAYHMAQEMPRPRQPLPVLKVLYRNSNRIHEAGGPAAEVLRPVPADPPAPGRAGGEAVRDAVRRRDLNAAERTFAALARGRAEDAFNALLDTVEDSTEVHRVVLPYRAWDLLDLVGREQAHTLLRQSVRYCVKAESWPRRPEMDRPRTLLPRLLDEYHLANGAPGHRKAEDAWIERMSQTIFAASAEQAAHAVAAALADGMAPDAVGEAVSLAANQLVLRDRGRPRAQSSPGKPFGSVHGDSIGVHACDSANAWRNMARVANRRHQVACLILAGYQVALDRVARGGDFLHWDAYPLPQARAGIRATEPASLLREAEAAIRENDQARACAAIAGYGEREFPERPVFDLLLRYGTSEDGALHAEKYYRTVREEFAATRPAFRWRQLVALARVTASEYGRPAPGYADACRLLGV